MKTRLLLLCLLMASYQIDAQCPGGTPDPGYTCIPDGNFEQALIDLNIDTNTTKDQQVLTSSIENLTSLDVSGYFISDLTGIEGFTSLQTLDCSSNNLIALDLFENTLLTEINCNNNNIGNGGNLLVLPNNNTLTVLRCGNNNLSSLNVSGYPALDVLHVYNNTSNIGALDLTNQTVLTDLQCHNSGVSSLDIDQCALLQTLVCYGNNLNTLDISGNPDLMTLRCYNNSIGSLDFTNNTELVYLDCGSNPLGAINVNLLTKLETLYCYYNGISSLNVSNNTLLKRLDCGGNPSLTSINITMLSALERFWGYENGFSSVDASSNMMLQLINCNSNANLTSVMLPDTTTLIDVLLCCSKLGDVTFLPNHVNVDYVDVGINELTSLDVSNLQGLVTLWCNQNLLTSLNLKTGNIGIFSRLRARDNALTCVDVDDVALAQGKSDWQVDNGVTFAVNCTLSNDEFTENKIALFPNPTRQSIHLRLAAEARYSIVNIMGKVVDEGILGSGMNTVDLSHTANGIYFLTLSSPEGRTTKKIMKQ
ncbi:T9SS type A sorting domain-containing protein [Aestuariivivens sediminicola]|uniref:T9SS type A sorting domain-containing protein n=1 Tax=Aestuariivivens sediminicola TaxID=2913560 RepID=UPI001F591D30|nr:T9SS type A sorting domain-containing protein [Aestuariivivens sediminicola]